MEGKDTVIAVLSYPYEDKLVIVVTRSHGRLFPVSRSYTAHYSDSDKVLRLVNNFLRLSAKLQATLIASKIAHWRKLYVQNH